MSDEWLTKEQYEEIHGESHIEDCLWAVIEKYEDGFILCPILATGGSCEECYEAWEERA